MGSKLTKKQVSFMDKVRVRLGSIVFPQPINGLRVRCACRAKLGILSWYFVNGKLQIDIMPCADCIKAAKK